MRLVEAEKMKNVKVQNYPLLWTDREVNKHQFKPVCHIGMRETVQTTH